VLEHNSYVLDYFGLTLTEKVELGFTRRAAPKAFLHLNTRLSVFAAGQIVLPASEGGDAAIGPDPGVSVQADPGLLHVGALQFQDQGLLTQRLHTGQIDVVLQAEAPRIEPSQLFGLEPVGIRHIVCVERGNRTSLDILVLTNIFTKYSCWIIFTVL